MKTILAPKAGFCFGVKRALDLATKTAGETDRNIYTLGPLIHNPQVVEELSKQGINVVKDISDIPEGVIIIRSHGVGPEIFVKAKEMGLQIIDATCPFVKKAHQLAQELNAQGYQVVVVGDKEHPEVTGIIGWTGQQGIVVETPEQAEKLQVIQKLGIISQTTQPEENFQQIISVIKNKITDVQAYNTICHATRDRQFAATELAGRVDVMVVVGGKNSANTQKLARLCAKTGTPTYHIETAGEIDSAWMDGKKIVGITAGASTPDWIIEEVKKYMEEVNEVNEMTKVTDEEHEKRQLEEALTVRNVRKGEIIKGIVVQIGEDEVLVDVGGKSEGIIPLREISCCDIRSPKELFKIGDEVVVAVISNQDDEGKILLSKRKADAEKAWDVLTDAMENKTLMEGIVNEVVKGGLLVDVGVQAFMPGSLVEMGYVEDLNKYIGQRLKAYVIEVKKESRKVILSRRAVLEEENSKKRAGLWDQIEEGQVIKGIVRRLTNFGAFVDIGGADGLLHVSEMAWYRVGHPSEILKENDEIEVFVLSADRKNEKISLSLKKIIPNPWQDFVKKYSVGKVIAGKVVRLAPFGAFVELEPGIDGLIHISQLSDRRVGSPSEVVNVGDSLNVKIIEVDAEKHKISLSLRDAQKDSEKAEEEVELVRHQQEEEEPVLTLGDSLGQAMQDKLNQVVQNQEEKATAEVKIVEEAETAPDKLDQANTDEAVSEPEKKDQANMDEAVSEPDKPDQE